MADPIRAALERLHQYSYMFPMHDTDEIVAAARAALDNSDGPAVSDGKGSVPTRPVTDDDLDLLVIAIQALTHQPDASTHDLAAVDRGREILRNAFTRWGRPAPAPAGERQAAPVPVAAEHRSDLCPGAAWLRAYSDCEFGPCSEDPDACSIYRAAELLEQQQARIAEIEAEQMRLKPVPVGDPPKPEDCDAEERCWLLVPRWILPPSELTHWLPAHALPIPQEEVE